MAIAGVFIDLFAIILISNKQNKNHLDAFHQPYVAQVFDAYTPVGDELQRLTTL